MAYRRAACYYLSGTGNSYLAARWLAQAAVEQGADAELIPISDARPQDDLERGPDQLVGIYHPTHGLMPPWSMIKFLIRLPMGRGSHAVVVATRGGIPLGPVVIPGAAALGLFFPMLILLLKGYSVRGGRGFDMPVNMLNLHWGMNEKHVDHVISWGKRRHQRLVDAVFSGKRYVNPLNVLWELVWCTPFVLWPVFPVAYLLVGRIFMAKLMFADTACRGCGSCARNCPNQAIVMTGMKPKTPFWTYHCEACMRCIAYCRFHAVQASHLWMVPVLYGASFLTASMVQAGIAAAFGQQVTVAVPLLELAAVLMTFLSLPVVYYLFQGLLRIRPLRTLFTYTTLTKLYSRRYHAPGVTLRDMNRRSEIQDS